MFEIVGVQSGKWIMNYAVSFPPKIEETKGFEHVSTWNKGGDFIIVI